MSTVLVTGAGRGMGRAITEEFIRRGHRVIGTARDPRSLEGLDLARPPGPRPHRPRERGPAAPKAVGYVDIVVINPAEPFYVRWKRSWLDKLQALFNLNTVGALRVAQAAPPGMRARGEGKSLFMSSVVWG